VIGKGGIIDQNIDTAESVGDFPDHFFHVARFGDIAQHKHRFMPGLVDFIDNRLPTSLMHFYDRDLRRLFSDAPEYAMTTERWPS